MLNDTSNFGRLTRRTFVRRAAGAGLAALPIIGAPSIVRAQTGTIGAVLPLSGNLSLFGQQARLGLELAAAEINSAGGILGQRIVIDYRDDAADPLKAEQAARSLAADAGTLAVAGPVTSASRNAMSATMIATGTPLLYATDYEGGDCGDALFYFNSVPNQSAAPLMRFLLKGGGERVFLLGADYVWPHRMFDACAAVITRRGGSLAGRRFLPLAGLSDYAPVIEDIRASGATILVLALPGTAHEAFVASADRAGLLSSVTVANLGAIALYSGIREPGSSLTAFGCVPFVATDPAKSVRDFVAHARHMAGSDAVVSAYVATHYNALMALKAGCEKSGALSRDAAISGMAGLTFETPTGKSQIDAVTHHSVLRMYIAEATGQGLRVVGPPQGIESEAACASGG